MTIKTRNNIFGISLSLFLIGVTALLTYFTYFTGGEIYGMSRFGAGLFSMFSIVSTVVTLVYIFHPED